MLWRMQRLMHQLRHTLIAPSRNPRAAVVIGRLLAVAFLLCFGTGLYSHFLQDPLPWMSFPTRPLWLYQVTQSRIHVLVTYGFLRSLARLDLADSRVGRFAVKPMPEPAEPVRAPDQP